MATRITFHTRPLATASDAELRVPPTRIPGPAGSHLPLQPRSHPMPRAAGGPGPAGTRHVPGPIDIDVSRRHASGRVIDRIRSRQAQQRLDAALTGDIADTPPEQALLRYAPQATRLPAMGAVDLDALSASGHTALHLACEAGNASMVEALLQAGAEPNMRHPRSGETPLHGAVRSGHLSTVARLRSDPRTELRASAAGSTPLDLAFGADDFNLAVVRMRRLLLDIAVRNPGAVVNNDTLQRERLGEVGSETTPDDIGLRESADARLGRRADGSLWALTGEELVGSENIRLHWTRYRPPTSLPDRESVDLAKEALRRLLRNVGGDPAAAMIADPTATRLIDPAALTTLAERLHTLEAANNEPLHVSLELGLQDPEFSRSIVRFVETAPAGARLLATTDGDSLALQWSHRANSELPPAMVHSGMQAIHDLLGASGIDLRELEDSDGYLALALIKARRSGRMSPEVLESVLQAAANHGHRELERAATSSYASFEFRTAMRPESRRCEVRLHDGSFSRFGYGGQPAALSISVEKRLPRGNPTPWPSNASMERYMLPPAVTTRNPLALLPPDQFVAVRVRKLACDPVWSNWLLREEMQPGTVLQGRVSSLDDDAVLEDRFCKMTVTAEGVSLEREDPQHGDEIMYVDRYGLSGSGRATTDGHGTNSKGTGQNPLTLPFDPIYGHSDGYLDMAVSTKEVIAGEDVAQLTRNRSTRIACILAPRIKWHQGTGITPMPMLAIRVGLGPRDEHYYDSKGFHEPSYDKATAIRSAKIMFGARSTRPFGDLETKLIEDRADRIAELRNGRSAHGGFNPGNQSMDGPFFDFGTYLHQPRGAPIYKIKHEKFAAVYHTFGYESHAALDSFPGHAIEGFQERWPLAVDHAERRVMCVALGLPQAVADTLLESDSKAVVLLCAALLDLERLHDRNATGDATHQFQAAMQGAVADVHRLLAKLPGLCFDAASGAIEWLDATALMNAADLQMPRGGTQPFHEHYREWSPTPPRTGPDESSDDERSRADSSSEESEYRGGIINRHGTSTAKEALDRVHDMARTIAETYPEVMRIAFTAGSTQGRWSNAREFAACVSHRAPFDNRRTDALISNIIIGRTDEATSQFETSHHDKTRYYADISNLLDRTLSRTRRRVDWLLNRTPVLDDATPGRHRLQVQVVDGLLHYVEAERHGARHVCIEVPLGDQAGKAGKRPAYDDVIVVRMPVATYQCGVVSGSIALDDGREIVLGKGDRQYTYAIPDDIELDDALGTSQETARRLRGD